MSEAKPSDH